MPKSTKAPLLAPLVRRRTQLMEKGVTRPRRKIAPRLLAGSSVTAHACVLGILNRQHS